MTSTVCSSFRMCPEIVTWLGSPASVSGRTVCIRCIHMCSKLNLTHGIYAKHMQILLVLRHGHSSPRLPPIDVRSAGASKALDLIMGYNIDKYNSEY